MPTARLWIRYGGNSLVEHLLTTAELPRQSFTHRLRRPSLPSITYKPSHSNAPLARRAILRSLHLPFRSPRQPSSSLSHTRHAQPRQQRHHRSHLPQIPRTGREILKHVPNPTRAQATEPPSGNRMGPPKQRGARKPRLKPRVRTQQTSIHLAFPWTRSKWPPRRRKQRLLRRLSVRPQQLPSTQTHSLLKRLPTAHHSNLIPE